MKRSRFPRRVGASLVEMVVVLSLISTVLTLSSVTVYRTMRAHARAEAFHDNERSAWRLSDALRRDLHQAVFAEALRQGATTGLAITTPDDAIVYHFTASRVSRERDLVDGKSARDEFSFHGDNAWSVERIDGTGLLEVCCESDPDARTAAGAPLRLRVVARVGSTAPVEGGQP